MVMIRCNRTPVVTTHVLMLVLIDDTGVAG